MQELINRAKELLADGTVARVLGWKAGDLNCARINIRYVSAIGAGRSTLCFIAWANM